MGTSIRVGACEPSAAVSACLKSSGGDGKNDHGGFECAYFFHDAATPMSVAEMRPPMKATPRLGSFWLSAVNLNFTNTIANRISELASRLPVGD
jgi:hypothetical protein